MFEKITGLDIAVTNCLVNLRAQLPFLNWLAWAISASAVVGIIIALYMYWLVYKKERFVWLLGTASVAVVAVVELLKHLTLRPRPNLSDMFSFPSTHTALAFLLAFMLPAKKRERYLLLAWAFLVGLSRIWLMEHWLSDVLVGAGIGTIIAVLFKKYFGKKK